MAVEIGAAYLSILPDLSKLGGQIKSGTIGEVNRVGAEMETRIGKSARVAGQAVGDEISHGAQDARVSIAELGLSIAAISAAAAGIGTAMSAGLNANRLQATLGVSPEDAARAGKTASAVYAAAWGDSMETVNQAVKEVTIGLGGLGKGKDLEGLTIQALAFKDAFGQDTPRLINAVSQLIRTGLVKSEKEAFDLLAIGFQNGANKADDLTDTLNEYSTQFRKLGLDGPTALGLISQAVKNGARDSDIAADALKEFSIRAVDGSKASADAYKALGLSATKMTQQIAKGGPAAEAGLGTVLDRLRKIKDPAKQAQIAVGLFGTQSEDLGKALFSMNPATAAASNGLDKLAGAGDRVTTSMGAATDPMEAFKRQAQASFGEAMAGAAPILTSTLQALQPYTGELTKVALAVGGIVALNKAWQVGASAVSGIQAMASGAASVGKAVGSAAASTARWTAATTASTVANVRAGVASAASTTATVAQTVAIKAAAVAGNVWRATLAAGAATGRAFAVVSAAMSVGNIRAAASTAAATAATVAQSVATKAAVVVGALWKGAVVAATAVQWLWNAAMLANPIGLIIAGIVLLVGAIVLLWTKSETFRNIVLAVWEAIKNAAIATWNWIKDVVIGAWNLIVAGVTFYINVVRTVITTVITWVSNYINIMVTGWKLVWTTVWNAIVSLVQWAIGMVQAHIARVKAIVAIVSGAFGQAKDRAAALLGGLVSFVSSVPGKILGFFSGLGSKLYNIGSDIVDGLKNGLQNAWHKVTSVVSNLVSKIPKGIRDILGISSPSKVTMALGQYTGQGLAIGLDRQAGTVATASRRLGNTVQSGLAARLGAVRMPAVAARGAGIGGGGSSHTYNVYPQRADFTEDDLEALVTRQDALTRGGRPR